MNSRHALFGMVGGRSRRADEAIDRAREGNAGRRAFLPPWIGGIAIVVAAFLGFLLFALLFALVEGGVTGGLVLVLRIVAVGLVGLLAIAGMLLGLIVLVLLVTAPWRVFLLVRRLVRRGE